ncbi:hypothetical protein DN53_17405 [Flagellimonas olearia]|uniref:Uncharacterized protein n=1 Tax=Flagellimonas olearia TaxID=552546 RepID=A0A444VJE3_9FLAO|nr:hypothetical protein DN53_17405 [Allomuricauda olearia]
MDKSSDVFMLTTITVNIGEERVEGLLELFPAFLINTVAKIFPLKSPFEQPNFLDFVQMLGYGGLGETNHIYQVIAYTSILFADIFQDGHACRMRHDLGYLGQFVMGW